MDDGDNDDTDDDTDDDNDDDHDVDTDDDNDHKNDSYTAAGAAPGASVPCSLFRFLRSGSFSRVPFKGKGPVEGPSSRLTFFARIPAHPPKNVQHAHGDST